MSSNVRVGAVQAEPVWLDLEGSVDKTISLIESAAADGVQVVCERIPYFRPSRLAILRRPIQSSTGYVLSIYPVV